MSEPTSAVVGDGVRRLEVDVPMRDGVSLKADVYLGSEAEPRPVLLNRTPYGRRFQVTEVYAHPAWYVTRGFAVVCQDSRGRGESGGEFMAFEHEARDGADTIDWLATRPWCDGNIGSYGFSYSGAVQLAAATAAPPALRAVAPAMTAADFGAGWVYRNGALGLAWILSWTAELGRETALRAGDTEAAARFGELLSEGSRWFGRLPIRAAFPEDLRRYVPYFADWLENSPGDRYWAERSLLPGLSAMSVPGLWIAGWYDVFLEATLEARKQALAATEAPQFLLIGPWWHTPWGRSIGEVDFGEDAVNVVDELQASFFSRWLKPDAAGAEAEPAVRVFVMGENRWRTFDTWPPATEPTTLQLQSDGRANSLNGTGQLRQQAESCGELPDVFVSDPGLPVASLGGRSCCYPEICPMGPADQRSLESRNDVLVYDSEPLERDLVVVGHPVLRLHVAADRPFFDLVVRLVDVDPDGRALNVSDGNGRFDLSGRSGAVEVELQLSPTAVNFRRQHRLRLDIAETSFPMFERNPHTGRSSLDARAADFVPVTVTIFHDDGHRSSLELPVLS